MAKLNVDTSIVDFLKSKNQDHSRASRASLAVQHGIVKDASQYTGTASQNIGLLNKLKSSGSAPPPATPPTQTPQAETPVSAQTTDIKSSADAETFINQNQQSDIETGKAADAPPTRKSTVEIFKEATGFDSVLPDTPLPDAPDFSARFQELRRDANLDQLEERLNSLQQEEDAINAQRRERIESEEGKAVALNVISGRVSEVERQEMKRLDFVARQKNAVINQINSKTAVINQIMDLEKLDFDVATEQYDREFTRRQALYDIAADIRDERQEDDAELRELAAQTAADARANGEIFINTMVKGGKKIEELDATQSAQLQKWGMEAGLGRNFFNTLYEAVSAEEGEKKLLTHVTSPDKSTVTAVYEDGSTSVIPTGITPKPTDNGSGETLSPLDIKRIQELYGFTPPLGVTMGEVEQFIRDNPDATPIELQEGMSFFFGEIDDGQGSTTTRNDAINERFLDKDYFRNNYTRDQLKDFSDQAGTSSFWTNKGADINRFLDLMTERVQTARAEGWTDREIEEIIAEQFLSTSNSSGVVITAPTPTPRQTPRQTPTPTPTP